MQPERLPLSKFFNAPFLSLDQTSVEMASLLVLFLAVILVARVQRHRQLVRHVVQVVSILVFFFVVYSCLGVFGMIRNSLYGLTLIGTVYTESFYWMALPVVVLSATLVSGPIFCGWICPTGTLQEWAAMLRKRLFKAPARPGPVRLLLLGLFFAGFLALVIAISLEKQMFLEDSSLHWGAALILLVYLVLAGAVDDLPTRSLRALSVAAILVTAVSHQIITSPVHFAFTSRSDPASATATLVIVVASLFVLRAWCRYLCPWGYLMGLVHRFSRVRIRREPSRCNDCKACERACDVGAIADGAVRTEHCQFCFACVDACPTRAFEVVDVWPGKQGSTLPLVLVVCLASALVASAARAGQDWPQSRHDAQNTAFVELDAPKSERPRPWSFDGSGRVWGYEPGMVVWTSAALGTVEGRAIVAVGSYDHLLYVLDASTGEQLFKLATGDAIYGAPVLWDAGDTVMLFVASSDRLVYAVDAASGRSLWVHSVEEYRPTLGGARLSSPCVGQAAGRDAVFVGHWVFDRSLGHSLQKGGVTALGARDGKPLWTRTLGDNEITAPIFARLERGNRLYVGSSDGNTYALDADTGALLWQKTELDAVRSPPALVPLAHPLLATASKFGMVRALDAETGAEVWSFKTGERVTGSPMVLAGGESARVVVGSYDRRLWALDALTGAVAWSYQARGGVYSSPAFAPASPPLVLAGAWDHSLHAVDARDGRHEFTTYTGAPLWNVGGLDDSNWGSPSVARIQGSWIVFHGSYDGTLRALPLDERARRAPPVRSNLAFWLSFPIALAPVAALALMLTRRARRRSARPV